MCCIDAEGAQETRIVGFSFPNVQRRANGHKASCALKETGLGKSWWLSRASSYHTIIKHPGEKQRRDWQRSDIKKKIVFCVIPKYSTKTDRGVIIKDKDNKRGILENSVLMMLVLLKVPFSVENQPKRVPLVRKMLLGTVPLSPTPSLHVRCVRGRAATKRDIYRSCSRSVAPSAFWIV